MAFDRRRDSLAEGAGGILIDLCRDVVDAEACVATGKKKVEICVLVVED